VNKNMLHARAFLICPALALILSPSFPGCKSADDHNINVSADTVWVNTTKPVFRYVSKPIIASGLLTTPDEAALSFKTPGIIENIKVREGQFVKKGQLLAALNLTEINTVFQQANINFDKTTRDYERIRNLFNDSVATKEQLQNAKSAMDAAKAQLEQAHFNMQHSYIYAPSDGYILHIMGNPGEITAAGYPVLFLGNTNGSDWLIKAGVTDKEMLQLSPDNLSYVTVDAYPGITFKGKIKSIAAFPDKYTGVYPVEIRFESGSKLAYGFSAKVRIIPSALTNRMMLPLDALSDMEDMHCSIWQVNNNRVIKTLLNIDFIVGDMAVVQKADESRLKPDARVITNGKNRVSGNSIIKIK
jgi:RND family efflux transporter MFP subunit